MDFYLTAPDGKRGDYMTVEERLTILEKKVAELKRQISVQPEKIDRIAEILASSMKEACAKMTGQK